MDPSTKSLQYRHVSMSAQIMYDADRGILDKVSDHVKDQNNAHLTINRPLSKNNDRLVLQSLTGSSTVNILPHQSLLNTTYYDSYTGDASHPDRVAYACAKISTLLDYLAHAGARMSFFGVVSAARISINDNNLTKDALLNAVIKFIGCSPAIADNASLFDFSVRFSTTDEDCFSNVSLSWFEERTMMVPITGQSGHSGVVYLKDWDMTVGNEGIEIRWDYNNKFALRNNDRLWDKSRYLKLTNRMFSTLPVTLARIKSGIEANLPVGVQS